MSERQCSYASETAPNSVLTPSTSSHEQSMSPGDFNSQASVSQGVSQGDNTPPSTASLSNFDSPAPSSTNINKDPTLEEAINLNHMELIIHLISDQQLFPDIGATDFYSDIPFALRTGLEWPYLLHQLLALSARHLAFLKPESSAFYLHKAVTLQTRAVSLFNATWTARPQVDQTTCVPILLFSSILGHHLLADTLAKRDPEGLEAFVAHYIQYAETHRGVVTVAKSAWPLLLESKLEPVLSWSTRFTSRLPRGNHCQQLKDLIDNADGLGDEEKAACWLAIQHLQVGFDATSAEAEDHANRNHMIFTWTMLAPPEFTSLLAAKRPETLVLLAYYAVLLHYGRDMWQVGDAGAYILGMIVNYLGSEWDCWLAYPREMVARDSLQASWPWTSRASCSLHPRGSELS